jgi:hypothetical protein
MRFEPDRGWLIRDFRDDVQLPGSARSSVWTATGVVIRQLPAFAVTRYGAASFSIEDPLGLPSRSSFGHREARLRVAAQRYGAASFAAFMSEGWWPRFVPDGTH